MGTPDDEGSPYTRLPPCIGSTRAHPVIRVFVFTCVRKAIDNTAMNNSGDGDNNSMVASRPPTDDKGNGGNDDTRHTSPADDKNDSGDDADHQDSRVSLLSIRLLSARNGKQLSFSLNGQVTIN